MGENQGVVSDGELRQLLYIFCKEGYKARETTSKVKIKDLIPIKLLYVVIPSINLTKRLGRTL